MIILHNSIKDQVADHLLCLICRGVTCFALDVYRTEDELRKAVESGPDIYKINNDWLCFRYNIDNYIF